MKLRASGEKPAPRAPRPAPQDFLLEIGCEELPADYLPAVLDWDREGPFSMGGFASTAALLLKGKGAVWSRLQSFGTPRRLVLHIQGLEPSVKREEKGPPLQVAYDAQGLPTRAAEAFAKKHGVKSAQWVKRDTPKGPALFASYTVPITRVLQEVIPEMVKGVLFPKTMRWEGSGARFARPIRWLLCLYGSRTVPCAYGDIRSSDKTFGTRREGSKALTVSSVKQYFGVIKEHRIRLEEGLGVRLLNPEGPDLFGFDEPRRSKREALLKQLRTAARHAGGRLADETTEEFQGLLTTVTFLAEDLQVQAGTFQKGYLDLPPEVLATSMAKYLRIFSVVSADGRGLRPSFLAVLEGRPRKISSVIAGYERILEARFCDARLFWRQDTRSPFEAKVPELAKMVFHEKLGSVQERTHHLFQPLMSCILSDCGFSSIEASHAERAAQLCKADWVTQMVKEFPSLQGVMGARYAAHSGEPEAVVEAIAEHYRPRTVVEPIPSPLLGRVLSLADRLDTLIGYFGVGLKPSGSADPYALRRQATGLIRILMESPKEGSFVGLSFDRIIEAGIKSWGSRITVDHALLKKELRGFLRGRFEWLCKGIHGVAPPLTEAVLSADSDNLAGAWERLSVLRRLWEAKDAGLLRAAKVAERTGRIVAAAQEPSSGAVDPERLSVGPEQALWSAWARLGPRVEAQVLARRYREAVSAYAELYAPVHAFFNSVMVMDSDPALRGNRLIFMRQIHQGLAGRFADLSLLPLSGVEIPDP